MCGIVGVQLTIGRDAGISQECAVRLVEHMARWIRHRGPDDCGTRADARGRTFLGSVRLAIQDLSDNGRMPMSNENGDVWVSFNGEIYNHLEMRDALISSGHEFRSKSDTEVIVHGYEEWGTAVFDRLDGMFAIAISDERSGQLVLARDRMGEKPLYYIADSRGVAFSLGDKIIDGGYNKATCA